MRHKSLNATSLMPALSRALRMTLGIHPPSTGARRCSRVMIGDSRGVASSMALSGIPAVIMTRAPVFKGGDARWAALPARDADARRRSRDPRAALAKATAAATMTGASSGHGHRSC